MQAVFLDRDGTLNEDEGYTSHPHTPQILLNVIEGLRLFNQKNIPLFVITNQAGIARGRHTEEDTRSFNASLDEEFKKEGVHVEGWYFCPHHPDGIISEYAKVCDCRKPMPGLLQLAAKEHRLDLTKSVMIGDKASDVGTAVAVGGKGILVRTGQGAEQWAKWSDSFKPVYVAEDLLDAATWLLAK